MSNLEIAVNIVAALGSAGAAIVAVVIAINASRSRDHERRAAAKAQARLIRIEVTMLKGVQSARFAVRIHNHSERTIIGAAVVGAWWPGHPEYGWRHVDIEHDREPVVVPARERESGGQVQIEFLDAAGAPTPKPLTINEEGIPSYAKLAASPDVVICFMDADGALWKTGTSIPPERTAERPTSLDPGGPITR